jgi:hypothetical protein
MKLDTIINALMDEKRFHKMLDVANDAVIKTRPAFDEGGNAPENFASMYIVFFVKETEYKYGKYTITAVSDYETGINWATIKKSLKDEKGSWKREDIADLPDEIADRLVRYGEMLVSHDCYKEANESEYIDEEYEAAFGERYESEYDSELESWSSHTWFSEKEDGLRQHNRLAEEAEYRDPRIYTSKYDSYFPCFA